MAGKKLKGLKFQNNSWWARKVVPSDARHGFSSGELWENLHTANPHDAAKLAQPYFDDWEKQIADVRAGRSPGETSIEAARRVLATRRASWRTPAPGLMMPVEQARWVAQLEHAASSVDGWKAIPGFDELVAKVISTTHRVDPAQPVVASMRQEVAAHLAEQERLFPLSKGAQAVLGEARQIREGSSPKALPAPSIRIRALYDEWLATISVAEKEIGRLNHQIRRLIEVVGDKPANHLTKAEVREFMGLVARFPRKRSAELNALPMRQLIEAFEADVAVLTLGGLRKEVPPTLRATTADEWYGGYRRMFAYALDMDYIDRNPFEGIKRHAVKGAASVTKREFADFEIKVIFSAPMFNGFEGDGLRGYRDKPGSNIVRDAKYWLPILALFHGGRLTEFAAMPHADLKQSAAGSWYFDLTARQVKNESSQRLIPLHPKMVELGFLDYVSKLRTGNSPWLFPDLDHKTKHGPGHAFSKWWAHWMDKHGLCDPTITHHSWRHTWKRAVCFGLQK